MKMKTMKRSVRLAILIGTILFVGIPAMFLNFKGNIDNANNQYGVYTLEEIQTLGVDDPIIEKTKTLINDYQSYFSQGFSNVEISERIYYLENNIMTKIRVDLDNDEKDKPYFSLDIDSSSDKTIRAGIRLNYTYGGEFKESMNYINKTQLQYVADYFEIEDAYAMFENTFKDIEPNAENVYSNTTFTDLYEITTKEQYYPTENNIELEYIIEKTYE